MSIEPASSGLIFTGETAAGKIARE